jgi:hypothetical protein
MGMKSAACWFSPLWAVRTSAIGEPTVKTVVFDIDRILDDQLEELEVEVESGPPEEHFTEVTLSRLYHPPVGRTLAKIKNHLRDIYQVFSREDGVVIRFNGEKLEYVGPKVLVAPVYDSAHQPQGDAITWSKTIDFDFGQGLSVKGRAALRKAGSTSEAGFSLFRRKRLILGSADEKYRPQKTASSGMRTRSLFWNCSKKNSRGRLTLC